MYHSNPSNNVHHHQFINKSDSSTQSPIICAPSLIRQPTTLESLTSTFQSFSLPTFSSPFRHPNLSNPHNLPSDRSWTQPSNPRSPSHFSAHLPSHDPIAPHPLNDTDRTIFSTWFQFNHHRHLLLINPVGIALWDAEDLETLIQVCWIRWDRLTLSAHSHRTSTSQVESLDCLITPTNLDFIHNFEPISAAVLPSIDSSNEIFLVLLFNSLLDRSSKLITISANSGKIVNVIDLAGIAVELSTNRKTIVVATKSPLALHLYGWKQSTESDQFSLARLPCSPILDLVPRPKTGEPVFHLGQTRLLAYASSKPPNEREPPIATGPGFSFVFPPHGPHSPSIIESKREIRESGFGLNPGLSVARNSSPAGTSGASWRNSVAPNLDVIDETARKLGGGILSGAKYLSSWGQNLWNPNMDNVNSPRQSFHHSPTRNDMGIAAFSQSAPLPHKMSAARPTHSRYEETHGSSHGNVQIIDIFGGICSVQNAHGHQHSIFHMKVSSDPLTFLSLNPSSNLLLTSSIEGHSFHVFELRPASRVGTSYLKAHRLGMTGSRREATVWHRYKLTRGFTSAEVTDVVWRWDSKIVSVLTEHGTNHLFAIHPAGGVAGPDAVDVSKSPRGTVDPLSYIFGTRVHNPRIPQPLSVTVSAFEKIKHKPMRHHSFHSQPDNTGSAAVYGSAGYLDHPFNEPENLGNSSQAYPTSLVFVQPRPEHLSNSPQEDNQQVLFESHKRLPSILLYDPSTNSVTLYNFEVKKKLLNSVTSGVSSGLAKKTASPGTSPDGDQHSSSDVRSQASSSPSGLSQLMQQKTQTRPKLNSQDLQSNPSNVFINSFAPAVWNLGAIQDPMSRNINRFYGSTFAQSPEAQSNLSSGFTFHPTPCGQNWTSFAELDTFSHSLRILSRSIYTSHQFDFYNFTQPTIPPFHSFPNQPYQSFNDNSKFIEQLAQADFDHIKKKKLIVKREVAIQPGDLVHPRDSSDLFALSTVEINDNFINPHFSGARNSAMSGSNQMYAEPIRSAVEAVIDPTLASPKSSFQYVPEFPHGRPARKASSHGAHQNPLIVFKKSLANNVAPVVGVVNERMRKEFGKIASSAAIGEVGRRSIPGVGYWNGISESLNQRLNRKPEVYDVGTYVSEGRTSVSFEDDQDEAIRIDRSLFDDQGPSSSSMHSFTTTNSLRNPNSDELGLESNGRSGQSMMDEDLAEEGHEAWDGWTFEDDLEIKTQPDLKDPSPLRPEDHQVCLPRAGEDSKPPKSEVGWNSSMIHSILAGNQTAGLVTRLQEMEPNEDAGRIAPTTAGKPPSSDTLAHLRVNDNKADSDPASGSRSSSALSTSTSASTSAEELGSDKKAGPLASDHSTTAPVDLASKTAFARHSPSSKSSKNSKSQRSPHNHKKK